MADITRDDVRHIAGLARIGVPEERLDALVGELNGILAHMEVLAAGAERRRRGGGGRPSRRHAVARRSRAGASASSGRSPRSRRRRSALDGAPMPSVIDGFFLVPRLATHEDAGDES